MSQDKPTLRKNYSTFRRNLFNVQAGQPALEIATNLCDWLELGTREGTDYWLEGQIVNGGEFLFNGRLFIPNSGNAAGTVIDNFPKSAAPQGWTKRPRADGNGYELVSSDGTILFGYRVDGRICHVTASIYAADGDIVAESTPSEFRVYRPPMKIGRGGVVWE